MKIHDSSENPLEVIYYPILETSLDWTTDEASAVLFGGGVDGHEVTPEIVEKFAWSDEKIMLLERLRRAVYRTVSCGDR
jgi:hypothetical protein